MFVHAQIFAFWPRGSFIHVYEYVLIMKICEFAVKGGSRDELSIARCDRTIKDREIALKEGHTRGTYVLWFRVPSEYEIASIERVQDARSLLMTLLLVTICL